MPTESRWRGALRRITAPVAELDAAELRDARSQAGASPIAACGRGERVTVTGRLVAVSHVPGRDAPAVEATLFDGGGTVTLIWLGQRRITGVEPGRRLAATGRVARRGEEKVIYNPYYELEPNAS